MSNEFDTIIIGGGVAGLLTALRLALEGKKVLVIERDKIGSGSTISNHGMIHSGALYIRQHSHIVRHCQEAQNAFTTLLSEAELPCDDSVYIAPKEDLQRFLDQLKKFDYKYKELAAADVPELKTNLITKYRMISLKERVFSSAKILTLLTSFCYANGVTFLFGIKVQKIEIMNRKVVGVRVGQNEMIKAKHIVIASGLGTSQLLATFNSSYLKHLKSRLDMMVHLPKARLTRGLIFADLDKPILMPAKMQSALGSFFGGIQPLINGERKFPVDIEKANMLIQMTQTYFNEGYVSTENAQFYMCGKTDYTGQTTTEKGFINPDYYVIDHHHQDEIEGLVTILTGKMTLAFHASKKAADILLQKNVSFLIPAQKKEAAPDGIFATEPWSSVELL